MYDYACVLKILCMVCNNCDVLYAAFRHAWFEPDPVFLFPAQTPLADVCQQADVATIHKCLMAYLVRSHAPGQKQISNVHIETPYEQMVWLLFCESII